MAFLLEWRKLKRTGFLPALLLGGLLGALFPAADAALRPERYLTDGPPSLGPLLQGDWQLLALLNTLFLIAGACALVHSERAGGALEKMRALPVRESGLFLAKAGVLACGAALLLTEELASLALCSAWLAGGIRGLGRETAECLAYSLLTALPGALLALDTAWLCEKLWTGLGLGLMGLFLATVIPEGSFALSLFPYALAFRPWPGPGGPPSALAGALELPVLAVLGLLALAWERRRR